MLNNCNYDKVRLIHEFSKIAGFLKKHAIKDAEKNKHPQCKAFYTALLADVNQHIDVLRGQVEGLSKKGKFK